MAPSPVGRLFLAPLLLVAVVLLTFSPVLENQFVSFDDPQEIVRNPDLNPPSLSKLKWNWTHTRMTLYMPLTYYVWGAVAAVSAPRPGASLDPTAFHGLNLALHAICTLLIYALILLLWKRSIPALFGALIFAVHPLQTEAVAWASGMYTLLSSALGLGAVLLHCWAVQRTSTRRPDPVLILSSTALYAAALLVKPAAISLPLILGIIDLLILNRSLWQTVTHAIGWIVLGLPIVGLARYFQDVSILHQTHLWARPVIALDAIGFYLQKLVLPLHLAPDYGRTPGWVLVHTPQMMVCVFIACCALLAAWLSRRRVRWVTTAVAVMIAAVLPYLGLTPFDFQYISTVADRYAYLGITGVALFAAAISIRSRLATVGLLILCVIWSVLSHEQATHWRDDATLFGYTLGVNPDSLLAHSSMGYRAANQIPPDIAAAEWNYKAALRVWPEDPEVLFDLGNLYLRHNPAAAVSQYQLAIAKLPRRPDYHNNLAVAFDELGQSQKAYDEWSIAIALSPNYVDARNNRGDLCRKMNLPLTANGDYRAVLEVDPSNQHAMAMLKQMGQAR